MQREGYAAIVSTAFAVALTVTPGIQRWWLALPAWGVMMWASSRWYAHGKRDEPTSKFDGHFFNPPALPPKPEQEEAPPPKEKPPRGQKLDWLDVRIVTIAVSFNPFGETNVSMQLAITNRSTDSKARLKLFLGDANVSEETRQLQVLAAAPKYEVMRRRIPDTPGSNPMLYPPFTVSTGEKQGDVVFFHPGNRKTLPLASLIVEDVVSGAMWSVEIDPKYTKAVADNPTMPLMWAGPDVPIVTLKGKQLYRLP